MPTVVYKVSLRDSVGTALAPLREGERYSVYEEGRGFVGTVRAQVDIPQWHKVAVAKIPEGSEVVKFGYVIGLSTVDIEAGMIVHITNVLLDPSYSLVEAARHGLVLGYATAAVARGNVLRVGVNAMPTHPLFRALPRPSRLGVALSAIHEGGVVRLGNVVEPPHQRHSELYARVIKDFYRLLRASLVEFSRVEVG